MDDGEVISRREISLNSIEDLSCRNFGKPEGKAGENRREFELKMVCDGQNRFVSGGISRAILEKFREQPAGNSKFERVLDVCDPTNSKSLKNGLKRKPSVANKSTKTSGTSTVGNGGNSKLPENGQIDAGNADGGNSPVNLKLHTDGRSGEVLDSANFDVNLSENGQKLRAESENRDIRGENSAVNLRCPINGQDSGNGQKCPKMNRDVNEAISGGNSVVNLKLPKNGEKFQVMDFDGAMKVVLSENGVNLRLPENGPKCEKIDLDGRSAVNLGMSENGGNGMNLRRPKNGQKCEKIDLDGGSAMNLGMSENGGNGMNLRLPKNGPKCEKIVLDGGIAVNLGMSENGGNGMNLRLPKNGQKCEKNDLDGGIAVNLGMSENGGNGMNLRLPKNGPKCEKIDLDGGSAMNLGMSENVGNGMNLRRPKNGRKCPVDVRNGDFGGGSSSKCPIAEPPPKKRPSLEWGETRNVKEELFRGLGLVPRGVLHDNGRPVDRRHCVTGRRTVQADSELAERGAAVADLSDRPRNVFYPSGVPTMFDTEKFIGEIQKRPAIYDVRSKVYSNRVAKLKYWHEVGKEMYKGWEDLDQMERRSLVKELQIKWKSIRDHFMRQLKQNINGEGPKKKKYVHFDQLQFLTANLGVKRRWQPWKQNWDGDDAENSMSGSGCSRVKEEQDPLQVYYGPRHSYKLPKQEPEEEYMEFTPELPEERHFSFVTSIERADYDEREVPVAALMPTPQPEDLSYHKEPLYYHHQELSYHKELEGDRMGNKMFLLSLLPIMERLPDHANIRARLQLMEVLQAFVAHEDAPRRDYYNHNNHHNAIEKRDDCDASQQHSSTSHSDSDS